MCRSFRATLPLIIGFFCGKIPYYYRVLLRQTTCRGRASYGSLPLCLIHPYPIRHVAHMSPWLQDSVAAMDLQKKGILAPTCSQKKKNQKKKNQENSSIGIFSNLIPHHIRLCLCVYIYSVFYVYSVLILYTQDYAYVHIHNLFTPKRTHNFCQTKSTFSFSWV